MAGHSAKPGFDLSPDGIERFRKSLPVEIRRTTPLTGVSPSKDFLRIAGASNVSPSERVDLLMDNRFSLARQNMGPIRSMMMMAWTRQNAPDKLPGIMKEASFRQAASCILEGRGPSMFQKMLERNKGVVKEIVEALDADKIQPYQPTQHAPPTTEDMAVEAEQIAVPDTGPSQSSGNSLPSSPR